MPGGQRQGFGKRRSMRGRMNRNVIMARDMLGWIKSLIPPKYTPVRTTVHQPVTNNLNQIDKLNQLKHQAESIQSQLNEINARIHQIEKEPSSLLAHINNTVCTGCGRCVPICPQMAIVLVNQIAEVDQDKCRGCGICLNECPVGAIDLINQNIEKRQITKRSSE